MLKNKNIAFYAPIKPPDHHIPSGDRLIAQNLLKTLQICEANFHLASNYIAYSKKHNLEILQERKSGAINEANKLIEKYQKMTKSERPELWLTYHPYCKAPDWIGPCVSAALDIPYVTVEAAKTGQGGIEDFWKPWRKEAQVGLRNADQHLIFKPTDRTYLSSLLGSEEKLKDFPPFVDAENMPLASSMSLPKHWSPNVATLITTGMMRKGKKEQNFQILANVLKDVAVEFNLIVVGGGPQEDAIKSLFSYLDDQNIHWTGAIEHAEVLQWMRASDLFIWPGWKEPIGMVYLEAQLQELPILAYKSMGVPLVVTDKKTGLLADEDNVQMLATHTTELMQNEKLRKTMGANGRQKVLSQHGIRAAAGRLDQLLSELLT